MGTRGGGKGRQKPVSTAAVPSPSLQGGIPHSLRVFTAEAMGVCSQTAFTELCAWSWLSSLQGGDFVPILQMRNLRLREVK